MKTKGRFNKGIALALSASLVTGLTVALPGVGTKTKAETTSSSTPSIMVYADVDALSDETFTPQYDNDGNFTGTVGKLSFGTNAEGNAQEWFILGSDSGVNDGENNTAIFAAKELGVKSRFVMVIPDEFKEANFPSWTSDGGDYSESYPDMSEGTKVRFSHYGISYVRSLLQTMATDSTYFSEGEQNLLQATKVGTNDYENKNEGAAYSVYTTEDELYLASAKDYCEDPIEETIYVGSASDQAGNGIELRTTPYWQSAKTVPATGSNEMFWLRSPYTTSQWATLTGNTEKSMIDYEYDWSRRGSSDKAVRPAGNLDLTDVLFASAAEAADNESGETHTLNIGTNVVPKVAMTLRLKGEGVEITKKLGGTIGGVSLADDKVKVTRGTTDRTVTLIIQGKDGDTDWYYAKKITAENAGVPVTAADTEHASVDLSTCKIWVEAEGDDGMIYAVNEPAHEHTFPETWSNADGEYHWKECTASDCPIEDRGKSETIKAHDYGTEDKWFHNSTDHYKKCTVCESDDSIKDKAPHEFNTEGICTVCEYDIEEIHTLVKVPEAPATCTKEGNKEYWYCERPDCDTKWYAVLGILIELDDEAFEKNVVIPATGHTLGSYSYDSTNHWQECSVCHEKLNTAAHTFSGNMCTVCGYTKSSGGGSSSGGTTYDDGSTKNTDRSSGGSSSGGGSGSSGMTYLTGSTTGATGTGWVQDTAGKWWYYDATYGKIIGWVRDNADGKWYYVDAEKGRLYGWFYCTDDSKWYYLDANTGAVPTGWQTIGGKQYYFAPAPATTTYSFDTTSKKWVYNNPQGLNPFGSMYAATTTPDNQSVDADGAKIG